MKLRTGPATPDELAELLSLRVILGWNDWPDEATREGVLEWLRIRELKARRRRKSDQELARQRRQSASDDR